MEWFNELGNMLGFMPDHPALAFDMATKGPGSHAFGLTLADSMQGTQAPLDVYPQGPMSFPDQGA
jgi:hypothetical protein